MKTLAATSSIQWTWVFWATPPQSMHSSTTPTPNQHLTRALLLPLPHLPPLRLPALQVLTLNRRIQAQNRVPVDFPGFVREGFNVKVLGDGYVTEPSG